MGTSNSDKSKPKRRLRARSGQQINRIADALKVLQESHAELECDIEVVRLVWEMKFEGKGATEISRVLRMGPGWMHRTKRQVEEIAKPSKWRLDVCNRPRQAGVKDHEAAKFKPSAANIAGAGTGDRFADTSDEYACAAGAY